jgi:hypothetical protein
MASLESTVVLPAHFAMERELREQLSVRPGHQRCMEGRNELLLLVHEVPVAGESRRQPLYFWRRSDRCWLEPDGTGLGGLGALLERYARAIGDHEDLLEEADTAAEIFGILRHAGPLARSTRNLLQALNQALTADPDDRAIRGYRDRAVELERAADLLHQDARMTLDFWRAERALAGLLGMNVRIPGFLEPLFWGVLAAGIALGGVLLFLAGRGTRNGGDADPDPPA